MIHTTAGIVMLATLLTILETRAQDPGFFLDDWQEKTAEIPDYKSRTKPAGTPTVHINVDMGQKLNRVPDYIYGNNAVTWAGNLNEHTTVMTDINNLNPHVLRWPGGNLSQEYFWNRSEDQRPDDIPESFNPRYGVNDNNWEMSTDDYYDLLANTNSTGIPCVNYSYARYGTSPDPVAKAAHLAAEWVRYDNGRSKFWEIGNENFGSWEAGYEIDVSNNQDGQPQFISGQLYGQHCRVFIDSMRAAAAEIGVDIKIGVVAYDDENSHDAIQTVWNEGMMPEVGDMADFLIVHSYFTPYNEDSPVSTILNSTVVPGHIMSTMVSDMAEAGKPMIPVAFTEWNIFAVNSMQQVSFINGMHAALVLGEFVKTGYGLATRWDLTNAWNAQGNDHGMFSVGNEPGVDKYNPRPVFFYMYYFQKYFGDRMVQSSVTGNSGVVAYASSFSSGESGLVIVNKSTSNETVQVEFDNFEPGSRFYYHTLTGGDDNGDFSRKVYLNGYGTYEEGGGPNYYEDVKAFTADTEGGIKVTLPSRGTVYLMVDVLPPQTYVSSKIETSAGAIEVELSDTVILAENPAGFSVMANGSEPIGISAIEADPENPVQVNIILARDVLPDEVITLSYTGSDVMNPDGDLLVPFSNVSVENLLPGAAPQLVDAFTSIDGAVIHLVFNMDMKVTGSSAESFLLTVQGDPDQTIEISEVSVDDQDPKVILITPADPLFAEYDLLLSYSGTGVTSTDDALLASFDEQPVTNQAPGLPPRLVSADVWDQGFSIQAVFDKPMNDLSEYNSLFTTTVSDDIYTIDSIQSSGSSMTVFLADYIRYTDQVLLSYNGTAVTSVDRGVLQPVDDFQVQNSLPDPVVFEIPGTIDAELFIFNMGMVLVQCKDDGGGENLAHIDSGDWVDYEVNVLQTGFYKGTLRFASTAADGLLIIQTPDDGIINEDTLAVPFTRGWQEWRSYPFEIILHEGRQRMRIAALTSGTNINWLDLDFDRTLEAEFVSATTNATGDTIEMVFSKELDTPGEGETAGFSVLADGNPINITQLALGDEIQTNLLLALETGISADQENITVSYESGTLTATDQTSVAYFADMPVTNQVGTGTGSKQAPLFMIYPNPASDHITIESDGFNIASLEVVDLTGKRILRNEPGTPRERVTLDLHAPAGVYLLKIRSVNATYYRKLIVN